MHRSHCHQPLQRAAQRRMMRTPLAAPQEVHHRHSLSIQQSQLYPPPATLYRTSVPHHRHGLRHQAPRIVPQALPIHPHHPAPSSRAAQALAARNTWHTPHHRPHRGPHNAQLFLIASAAPSPIHLHKPPSLLPLLSAAAMRASPPILHRVAGQ